MKKPALPKFSIDGAFARREQALRAILASGTENAGHPGVQGDGTENNWHHLLSNTLPNRYKVARAFAVDSEGGQSEQIDLAIIDRHFSPLFWEWGGHLYIPAESVYAAFEIKPTVNRDYIAYAGRKVASVRSLVRTSVDFGWARGTMAARELPPILGGVLAGSSSWSTGLGLPFKKALAAIPSPGELDLGCALGAGAFESSANGVSVSSDELTLVAFWMTLMKRLQAMGSAPALDYNAYSRSLRFNAISE